MSEPATLEQLRERIVELQVKAVTAGVDRELAEAQRRATEAEARSTYLARRVDELEGALGRRQRVRQDRSRGIERLRDNGAAS